MVRSGRPSAAEIDELMDATHTRSTSERWTAREGGTMRYLPHTADEIRDDARAHRRRVVDALFEPIPASHRFTRALDLEPTLDEPALMAHLHGARATRTTRRALVSFLGAGMYDHHIPPAVDQLLMRSEFYTAYTPYQAEVSQGTLQAMFEFQTIVCQLFAMDISNSSMYDGASAAAEAGLMARRLTGRGHMRAGEALHPEYTATSARTARDRHDRQCRRPSPRTAARTSPPRAEPAACRHGAVVVGYPNFFGCVEDLAGAAPARLGGEHLLVTATAEPYALSLLRAAGRRGRRHRGRRGPAARRAAAVRRARRRALRVRRAYLQKMPGRLVGETVDAAGQRGFMLTLSTREQHIRRERATSNICTNNGLIALALTIRTAMLGRQGFATRAPVREQGRVLKQRIPRSAAGTRCRTRRPPSTSSSSAAATARRRRCSPRSPRKGSSQASTSVGSIPGVTTSFLVAVTERHGSSRLDRLVEALADA